MTREQGIRLGLAAAVTALAAALVLAGWQWQRQRGLARELARFPAASDRERLREDAAAAAQRVENLQRRITERAARAAGLEPRYLPAADPAVLARRRLELLELAARCGLAIDELRALAPGDEDPALAAWKRRFALDPGHAPTLLRLGGRGSFAGLLRFAAALDQLPWAALPVQVAVERVQRSTAGDGEAARPPRRSGELRCSLVVTL